MELSKRLTKVAKLVRPAKTMADVGCDHGYLSVYLVEHGKCQHMIAMDVNKGPLQKAQENIERYGYCDYIETRLSDGINKLKAHEAEGYICAGMGGPLALQILWNDRDKVKDMQQVILQPQSELWLVRRTLKQWGFVIEKEDIEEEDGKYYFMMRIRPGETLDMEQPPKEDVSLFVSMHAVKSGEDDHFITSEEMLETWCYELFAKELLEEGNELLKEYICKEMKRLSDIYGTLCQRKASAKSRDRLENVKRELAIHQWALSHYEAK